MKGIYETNYMSSTFNATKIQKMAKNLDVSAFIDHVENPVIFFLMGDDKKVLEKALEAMLSLNDVWNITQDKNNKMVDPFVEISKSWTSKLEGKYIAHRHVSGWNNNQNWDDYKIFDTIEEAQKSMDEHFNPHGNMENGNMELVGGHLLKVENGKVYEAVDREVDYDQVGDAVLEVETLLHYIKN